MLLSSQRNRLLLVALIGGSVLQVACAPEPTSLMEEKQVSFAASDVQLTVGGPSSITVTGNYTYGAHFAVPYAWFNWWTRTCNTATVASCTSAWLGAANVAQIDPWTTQLTKRLIYNCGFKAPVSHQVKVTAGGFGVPPQTAYKVTLLCGEGPL